VANRHTVIVIVSIIVIAATLGYSSLNVVSAKDLQFRWHQSGSFDLLSIMFGGKLVACNNSDYPANFAKYSFNVIYDGQSLGTFSTNSGGVLPHTSMMIDGKFSTDDNRVSQILLASLDTALGNSEAAARINVNKVSVIATLDTTVIGIVPFSITHEYSGQEFLQMMNQKTRCDK
jgi:hypothetical protein